MDSSILLPATLIITGLIVLVLVIYLIAIIIALRRAGNHLEALAGGLRKIAEDTTPLSGRLETINGTLGKLREGLSSADQHLIAISRVLKL
jgi:hypothetical protein